MDLVICKGRLAGSRPCRRWGTFPGVLCWFHFNEWVQIQGDLERRLQAARN